MQLLLLPLHASGGGDEAPPEAFLLEGVFMDYIVIGVEALVFLRFRLVVIVSPFEEVVRVHVLGESFRAGVSSGEA